MNAAAKCRVCLGAGKVALGDHTLVRCRWCNGTGGRRDVVPDAVESPPPAKRKARGRTTHDELSRLIRDHVGALGTIPGVTPRINDSSTLRLLLRAAEALLEQDDRIDELTVALREHGGRAGREALRHRTAREEPQ